MTPLLAVAPVTDVALDMLGLTQAGGLIAVVVIAGVYLWATRTGRKK